MGIIDPKTGEFVYTNAGHNPPVVVRASGEFELLKEAGGIILGILPLAVYKEARMTLNPGDTLVLFTDGVTEAADPSDEEYGEARLAALVTSMKNRPSEEIVEAIHSAVGAFTQGAPAADDITVVVARRL
jgi:sigma-B regulation protein RsbU (phosphoserine phosphatase)